MMHRQTYIKFRGSWLPRFLDTNSIQFKISLSHLQQYRGNVLIESMVTDHDTRLRHSTPQTQKTWSARKAIIFSERHKFNVCQTAVKVMASFPANTLISGLGAQQSLWMPAETCWGYSQEQTWLRTARCGLSAVQCNVTSLQSRHWERLQRPPYTLTLTRWSIICCGRCSKAWQVADTTAMRSGNGYWWMVESDIHTHTHTHTHIYI